MIKQNYQKPSQELQDEAMQKVKRTQQSSQIKKQTKLIGLGIRKGIDLYKKHQKGSAKCLSGELKKQSSQQALSVESDDQQKQETAIYQQRWLPWMLLIFRLSWGLMVLAWVIIGIYLLV